MVNLGDYIYAEAYHARGSASGGVRTDPVGEATSLADYRAKYQLYRGDAGLRKMHAQVPDDLDLGRPRGAWTTTPAAPAPPAA